MDDQEILIFFNIPREDMCRGILELRLDVVLETNIFLNIKHLKEKYKCSLRA